MACDLAVLSIIEESGFCQYNRQKRYGPGLIFFHRAARGGKVGGLCPSDDDR